MSSFFVIFILVWNLVGSVEDCFFLKDQCQLNCPSFGLLEFGPILEEYSVALVKDYDGLDLRAQLNCAKLDEYEWTLDNSQEVDGFEGVAKDFEEPMLLLKCSPSFSITLDSSAIAIKSTHVCPGIKSVKYGLDTASVTSFQHSSFRQESLHWTELDHKVVDLALIGKTLYSLRAQKVQMFHYDDHRAVLTHKQDISRDDNFNDCFSGIAADNEKVIVISKASVYAYFLADNVWSLLFEIPPCVNLSTCLMALSGTTLLISNPAMSQIFFYTQSLAKVGDDRWAVQTIQGPHESYFGLNIAIDGDTALIVAPHTNEVWCYQRQADQWKPVASIVPRPSLTFAITSVAMSNGVAVITDRDYVHMYKRTGLGWVHLSTIYEAIHKVVLSADTLMLVHSNAIAGVSLSKILLSSPVSSALRGHGLLGESIGLLETQYIAISAFLFFILCTAVYLWRLSFVVVSSCMRLTAVNLIDDRESE